MQKGFWKKRPVQWHAIRFLQDQPVKLPQVVVRIEVATHTGSEHSHPIQHKRPETLRRKEKPHRKRRPHRKNGFLAMKPGWDVIQSDELGKFVKLFRFLRRQGIIGRLK